MSYTRCRPSLLYLLVPRAPASRAPQWSTITNVRRVLLQTRSKHGLPQENEIILDHTLHYTGRYSGGVKLLQPAIWALLVSSGIYISAAYLKAKEELKPKFHDPIRFQDPLLWTSNPQTQVPPTPTQVAARAWDPMWKLTGAITVANGLVYLGSFAVPNLWSRLWHIPITNRNYTLLTSTFVHGGALHFGLNTYACFQLLPAVGHSPLFRNDYYHALAFYLSTGVISGFAQHLATAVFKQSRAHPRIPSAVIPSGGASGALFALFGAFCMQYPDRGVGIIFVPFYVDAQYFLPAVMLFDLVGIIRGYSFANLGHAAHLGGATIGAAYSYLDGHSNVWRPLVEYWKRRLHPSSHY